MLIRELVEDRFGITYMDTELAILEQLAGKTLCLNAFYADTGWLHNGQAVAYFLTRYFLPIANLNELIVGLHLLPAYVTQEQFVIAQLDPESNRLIDYAYSLKAYSHRLLLEAEAEGEAIDADLELARDIFGKDFYPEPHNPMDLEREMINIYGGAAVDFKDLAQMARLRKSTGEEINWLQQGAAVAPNCMYFHWQLAQLYAQSGKIEAAAESFAHSLNCHHHTGYKWQPESYYTLGRELLEKVPAVFTKTAGYDLDLIDGEARMEWLIILFQKGKVETSLKLLSDFRYDSGTDLHPALLDFLRLHYEQLGWKWALEWCALCKADENANHTGYQYRGQPLAANWVQPVQDLLKLS